MTYATLTPPETDDTRIPPTVDNLHRNENTGLVTIDAHHHYTHLCNLWPHSALGYVAAIGDREWVWVTWADSGPSAGTTDTCQRAMEELLDTYMAGEA